MKNYIVSEEELKELANYSKFNHPSVPSDENVKGFLESKQPVELVAEGVVTTDSQIHRYIKIKDNEWYLGYIGNFVEDNQHIEIYISKVESENKNV